MSLSTARARILASYLILLLFSAIVGGIALRSVLLARAGERVDDSLVQETEEFRTLADRGRDPRTGEPFGDDVERIFDVFLSRNVPGEGETFISFVSGNPYRTAGVRTPRIPENEGVADTRRTRSGEFETDEGRRVRYLAVPVRIGGSTRGVFVVAIDLTGELDEVDSAMQVAAGVAIGVLVLASLLAWVVAGRVLAPLRQLRDTAQAITDTDLGRRISVQGDDELADLARTFNAMLDRLENAFASQKSFISDAGHELRTPITIVRGHLELLGDDPEERRATIELVTDELDRMSRLVNDLLLLAKAQRPDFLQPETLDAAGLTEELFAKASALAPRDWRLAETATGRIVADRQRITQAVMNLSQNAVHHTGESDAIELGSSRTAGEVRLWVRDTGPGVPEADRERVFARFARANSGGGHVEGTGLGLAITRAIAQAHGGDVQLDPLVRDGARFVVTIPIEPPQEVSPREPDTDRRG
ncbi:MAG TPA: ATP-binding protein [Thermoleophilaceae bacterium]|jgi:two-component system, OmpR family, sensor kinase|nr:ATP-binding protein [Thermoleophilaceae bacterium]